MLEALFTFLLIISVAYGAQTYTEQYLREETSDLRADRVENAAIILNNYESGEVNLDISGYEVKIDQGDFILKIEETENSRDITNIGYATVDGPNEFEEFDQICLEKTFDNELEVSDGC